MMVTTMSSEFLDIHCRATHILLAKIYSLRHCVWIASAFSLILSLIIIFQCTVLMVAGNKTTSSVLGDPLLVLVVAELIAWLLILFSLVGFKLSCLAAEAAAAELLPINPQHYSRRRVLPRSQVDALARRMGVRRDTLALADLETAQQRQQWASAADAQQLAIIDMMQPGVQHYEGEGTTVPSRWAARTMLASRAGSAHSEVEFELPGHVPWPLAINELPYSSQATPPPRYSSLASGTQNHNSNGT